MKSYCIIFTIFLFHTVIYAQWSSEISVNKEKSQSNLWPRIEKTSDAFVVLWGESNLGVIHSAIVNNNKVSNHLSPNKGWTKAFITDWASTELDATDNDVFIIYKAINAEKGHTFLMVSDDGGTSFSEPKSIINGDEILHRFPDVDYSDETIHVSYMHFEKDWKDPKYVTIKSTDGGVTFTNPVDVTSSNLGEACDCCVAKIISNEDKVSVLYRNNDGQYRDIYATVSHDRGDRFSEPVDMDKQKWELFQCPSTGADVFMDEKYIYGCFMSSASGRPRNFISQMDLFTGEIIHESTVMDPDSIEANELENFPQMAGNGDTLGIVWQQSLDRERNIYFTYTTTGVANIGRVKLIVNDEQLGTQINPDIAFRNGSFHFTWQDNRSGLVKYRAYKIPLSTSVEFLKEANIKVYPNPSTNGVFNLEVSHEGLKEAILYDENGRKIRDVNLKRSTEINISDLPQGNYFLKMDNYLMTKLLYKK